MPEFVGPLNWSTIIPPSILCLAGSIALIVCTSRQGRSGTRMLWFSALSMVAALVASITMTTGPDAFSGAVAADGLTQISFVLLSAAGLLTFMIFAGYAGRKEVESGEFHGLIMFATAGMMVMASGRDLVTIFIGLEVASISQYILAAFRWNRRQSTEASVKYLILGAFATSFLVFGISLVYGATGSLQLAGITAALSQTGFASTGLLIAGLGMMLVGFGFKVSAVPFHQWTPDVYQGAPTIVTGFMAAGPKVAAFIALFRIAVALDGGAGAVWTNILWWMAVLTMVVGNLMALVQQDLKRLFAYSAIAHAGYLLVAVTVGQSLAGVGIVYYLVAYVLTTLGAFGVLALLKSEDAEGTDINALAGMGYERPFLGAVMAIFMFSLGGIPPTAGFIGKFYIFGGAIQEGFITLAIIGVLNSALAIYYYLRVVIVLYMKPKEREDDPLIPMSAPLGAALGLVALGILILGVYPGPLYAAAKAAVEGLGLR